MEHKLVLQVAVEDANLYRYKGNGFVSFKCGCGHLIEIELIRNKNVIPCLSWQSIEYESLKGEL